MAKKMKNRKKKRSRKHYFYLTAAQLNKSCDDLNRIFKNGFKLEKKRKAKKS